MRSSATLTTVPSSMTTPEPSTVVSSTHRAAGVPIRRSAAPIPSLTTCLPVTDHVSLPECRGAGRPDDLRGRRARPAPHRLRHRRRATADRAHHPAPARPRDGLRPAAHLLGGARPAWHAGPWFRL